MTVSGVRSTRPFPATLGRKSLEQLGAWASVIAPPAPEKPKLRSRSCGTRAVPRSRTRKAATWWCWSRTRWKRWSCCCHGLHQPDHSPDAARGAGPRLSVGGCLACLLRLRKQAPGLVLPTPRCRIQTYASVPIPHRSAGRTQWPTPSGRACWSRPWCGTHPERPSRRGLLKE